MLSLLVVWVAGHLLACSAGPQFLYRPLSVTYLPHLVKGLPDRLPPRRILVLLPLDRRQGLVVREGEVPLVANGADILWARQFGREMPAGEVLADMHYPVVGFRGTSSRGSLFIRNPSHFFPPDRPRLLFYMSDLKETVQQALATHLRERDLQVTVVPFSRPQDRSADEGLQADYALGCSIEEFVLLSLFYYVQTRASGDFTPVLGPTWAQVTLTLSLSRWPSGEQLWEGRVGERLTDPLPGEDIHLYGTMGEAMSMALSRAVGSFLIMPAVQDLLSRQ